jgi:hypothetical protein
MSERSYTVRVHTHPETWRNHFLANQNLAPAFLFYATQFTQTHHPENIRAVRLPLAHTTRLKSTPRTCTVRCHSAYLNSPDVIQRVIWESTPRVVATFPTREAD